MPEYFQTQWPHAKAQSSQRNASKLCTCAPLRENRRVQEEVSDLNEHEGET
jgi:hypothetical protein